MMCSRFLLTHLMRGATYSSFLLPYLYLISTHTPHARCNPTKFHQLFLHLRFLLTHLMRGATIATLVLSVVSDISTHTPHARCNSAELMKCLRITNFYSHTSCEVQRNILSKNEEKINISTHTPHARCNVKS